MASEIACIGKFYKLVYNINSVCLFAAVDEIIFLMSSFFAFNSINENPFLSYVLYVFQTYLALVFTYFYQGSFLGFVL